MPLGIWINGSPISVIRILRFPEVELIIENGSKLTRVEGPCQDWIDHMQANGFKVTVHETGNAAVRAKLGLPQRLGSCHTALVGGYLLEGHVPAADVHKLLKEKPKALGLTVPGMPVGSPGMDGPEYKGRKDAYDVLLVTKNLMNKDVSTRVFTSYR